MERKNVVRWVVVPRWVCQEDRGGDLFDRKFEISTASTQQTSNSTNTSPSLPNNQSQSQVDPAIRYTRWATRSVYEAHDYVRSRQVRYASERQRERPGGVWSTKAQDNKLDWVRWGPAPQRFFWRRSDWLKAGWHGLQRSLGCSNYFGVDTLFCECSVSTLPHGVSLETVKGVWVRLWFVNGKLGASERSLLRERSDWTDWRF